MRIENLNTMDMFLYLYWLLPIIIGLICILVVRGVFDACLHALLGFINRRQRELRLFQRPNRIFLIRHGESQANVDTSKIIFFFLRKNSLFLSLNSFIFPCS